MRVALLGTVRRVLGLAHMPVTYGRGNTGLFNMDFGKMGVYAWSCMPAAGNSFKRANLPLTVVGHYILVKVFVKIWAKPESSARFTYSALI